MLSSHNNTMRTCVNALLVLLISCTVLSACTPRSSNPGKRYITWDGMEPDQWASIWLIKRHIDPQAEIVLRPVGAPTQDGNAFGVPGAKYNRTQNLSLYESLLKGNHLDDPVLIQIGHIVHDIEISPWAGKSSRHTNVVEQAYRDLQERFEQRMVPADCYGRFFDEVYELLMHGSQEQDWQRLYSMSDQSPECRMNASNLARRDLSPFVQLVPTSAVLKDIGADKNVIFVDTRESAEYAEYHIPGAINLQLREVEPALISRFDDADLVIAYCIKDFRGFEMARSLAEIGVRNVGTMKPYGIAGWQHLGLPVTRGDDPGEDEAMEMLRKCAHAQDCISNAS